MRRPRASRAAVRAVQSPRWTGLRLGRPRMPIRTAARSSRSTPRRGRSCASTASPSRNSAGSPMMQRRIASLQHRAGVGRHRHAARDRCRTVRRTRCGAGHSTCGSSCRRQSCGWTEAASSEKRDRRHRTIRRDGKPRNEQVRLVTAQVFDRGNHPEVDRVLVEQRRTLRGGVEPQRKQRVPELQPIHERPCVEIPNSTETNRRH